MTKKEIRRHCDYWMLNYLNAAIRYINNGYDKSMVECALEQASAVMLMASSLKVITEKEFDNI